MSPEAIEACKQSGKWPKFFYETDEEWSERIVTAHWMYLTYTKPVLDEVYKIIKKEGAK